MICCLDSSACWWCWCWGASWGPLRAFWRPLGSSRGLLGGLLGASWGPPGGLLGASWGPLGGLLGPLGGLLGASWCLLGAFWGPLGARKRRRTTPTRPRAKKSKSLCFTKDFNGDSGRGDGEANGDLGRGPPGGLLGASRGLLGPSWAPLGARRRRRTAPTRPRAKNQPKCKMTQKKLKHF